MTSNVQPFPRGRTTPSPPPSGWVKVEITRADAEPDKLKIEYTNRLSKDEVIGILVRAIKALS